MADKAKSAKEQFLASWPTTVFSGALFCAVAYLLFWNEKQAIMTIKSIEEAGIRVYSADPFLPEVREHEGHLLHICGPIRVPEPLTEPDYNIQVLSAKLKKRVQMYQWIEEAAPSDSDSDRDASSYNYYTDWRDHLVDSGPFYISPGHHNPKEMPASGQTHVAERVYIGEVALGLEIKKKFSDYYEITSDERPDRHDIKLHSGAYYHGADPLVHEVGDLRVTFSYAGRNNDEYCAIGTLEKSTLQPFQPSYWRESIAMLRKGRHDPGEMLQLEFEDSMAIVWRYRTVGWFQMFAASMSLHPDWFTLLLRCRWVSPRMRRRGRVVTNLALATCGTLLIISIAWIIYSPVFSLTLLGVAILPIIYFSNAFKSEPYLDYDHLQ